MKIFKYLSILSLPLMLAWACTDLAIETQDGAWINGRSMEFAVPMQTKISLSPKGMKHQSQAPNGQKGLSWTSKYGYISMDCLDQGFTKEQSSLLVPTLNHIKELYLRNLALIRSEKCSISHFFVPKSVKTR